MLPFSAPLHQIATRTLPYTEVDDRLAGWFNHSYSVAFVSDGKNHGGQLSRYSYLMAEPDAFTTLAFEDLADVAEMLTAATGFVRADTAGHDLPPFTGGLVGMAAFELGLRLENLKRRPFRIEGRKSWPELVLMRFPAVLAFDHHTQTLTAIGRGASALAAQAALSQVIELYNSTPRSVRHNGPLSETGLVSETPDEVHEDKVAALVQQIHAGDLFQANLARGWTGQLKAGMTPGDVLAALHRRGPAPFGGYMRMQNRAVVTNSPERYIRLYASGEMETRPIKGTRPRGATPQADAALAEDLLRSEKDRAENLMIVDLMRHDLSRVAQVGSVKVEALHALESYANVHHLVSTVRGQIRTGLSAADLLCASFPPGSISGAPKVQAMKVISEMEAARGPYCGSLFWVDAGGAMDSNVLIRTLALECDTNDRWQFRAAAGGGIVADSDPRAERIETETKLSLIRSVLEGALPPDQPGTAS